ncbi:13524_t:CDS:2 [Ambispora gerdemannii]|uniref:RNA-dependent RNA polymerase n=1 Tax=Ambispora gerdemannii TaxID=144530 RepID=A0A9N8V9E3_9GLOM|nr:13524_t:CDS:2 [Ambispora gerdemannii]
MEYHPTVQHWRKRVTDDMIMLYPDYGRFVKFVTDEDLKLMEEIARAGTAKLEELGVVVGEFLKTKSNGKHYKTFRMVQKEFHAKLVKAASGIDRTASRKETILYPRKKYDPASFSTLTSPNSRREVPSSCHLTTKYTPDRRTGTVYNFLNSNQTYHTSPISKLQTNVSIDGNNKSDDKMSNEILFNRGSGSTSKSAVTPTRKTKNKNIIVYDLYNNDIEDNGNGLNNKYFNHRDFKFNKDYEFSTQMIWYTPIRLDQYCEEQLSKFSFDKSFEIVRFMKPFGKLDWVSIDWRALSETLPADVYDEMHRLSKKHLIQILPKKASNNTWESNGNDENCTTIIFSAVLEWTPREHQLRLNPPKRCRSKRFYRQFDSDRFLSLKLDADLQKISSEELEKLKKLLLAPITLAGRTFEFLYGKDSTIFYFATRGKNIKEISIDKLIDWHIPFRGNNLDMSVSKFVSRISLGLSDTQATVVFQPNQIRIVKDVKSENGEHCLTDGCGTISLLAMKKVAEIMLCTETPCALQARIGSAKGIWFLDPNLDSSSGIWIELRESQIKYDIWCSDEDRLADKILRTLDVVKLIKFPSTSGYLNTQYIRVLECGGVGQEVFVELVQEDINEYRSRIVGCNDPLELINWLEESCNIMGMRLDEEQNAKIYDDSFSETSSNNSFSSEELGEQDISSGFPSSVNERCLQMLHAGFTPQTCPYLAQELTGIVKRALNKLSSKFRIKVPLSRVLTCIADPTGSLNPGEIFIQLDPRAGLDTRTGLSFGVIEGDVIVARTPCLLPSDICKVRAVKNTKLLKYFNIVIFPIKTQETNEGSLVSRLSGGDYDGDVIFCCWEPRIAKPFRNSPVLKTQSAVKDAILTDKTKIKDILYTEKPRQISLQEKILDIHIKDITKKLNLYNYFHDLCVDRYGIQDRKSIYFAQMCGYLVDALKQAPDEDISRQNLRTTGFMDSLLESIRGLLTEVNSPKFTMAPNATNEIDDDLTALFGRELEQAKVNSPYYEDLRLIENTMVQLEKDFRSEYSKALTRNQEWNKNPENAEKPRPISINEELANIDQQFIQRFLESPPISEFRDEFLKSVSNPFSPKAALIIGLKASCLYTFSFKTGPTKVCCWKLAFRALCNIKSFQLHSSQQEATKPCTVYGGPRHLAENIWITQKLDKRWIKNRTING